MPGTENSTLELTHVSRFGLRLRLDDEEFFLPFEQLPWFRRATIEQLSVIERPTSDHLYGPLLDVDLAVQSIRKPSEFPHVAKDAGRPGAPADLREPSSAASLIESKSMRKYLILPPAP